jgi:hypothetical protein
MAVETAAVFSAFTSTVGTAVAPMVQDVSNVAAARTIMNTRRGDFETNMFFYLHVFTVKNEPEVPASEVLPV